jgi:hypothetical protein
MAGKRACRQNSCKYDLNSAPNFVSFIEYKALVDLIVEEWLYVFNCADIAVGFLNYWWVIDAYYDTSTSPEPVDDFYVIWM